MGEVLRLVEVKRTECDHIIVDGGVAQINAPFVVQSSSSENQYAHEDDHRDGHGHFLDVDLVHLARLGALADGGRWHPARWHLVHARAGLIAAAAAPGKADESGL